MQKVVMVTGGAGWLGSQIARRFASGAARVALVDIARAANAMEKLAAEINRAPGECQAFTADIRSYEELQDAVEQTVARWDRLDMVVNTAGGSLRSLTRREKLNKPLLDYTGDEWDIVVDTNLKGAFNCLKAVAPQMIRQRDGHIILVASGQGMRPEPGMSIYAAAKAGVFGLMKAAAREFGKHNVRVNAVNPGFIPNKVLAVAELESDVVARYTAQTTLGRVSTPEEFADFLFYLSQTNNISGQTFNLDSLILF